MKTLFDEDGHYYQDAYDLFNEFYGYINPIMEKALKKYNVRDVQSVMIDVVMDIVYKKLM